MGFTLPVDLFLGTPPPNRDTRLVQGMKGAYVSIGYSTRDKRVEDSVLGKITRGSGCLPWAGMDHERVMNVRVKKGK